MQNKITSAWSVDNDGKKGIFLNTAKGTWTIASPDGSYIPTKFGNHGVIVYIDGTIEAKYKSYNVANTKTRDLYDYLLSLSDEERIKYAENIYKSLKTVDKFKL